jgi:hypothetical protein
MEKERSIKNDPVLLASNLNQSIWSEPQIWNVVFQVCRECQDVVLLVFLVHGLLECRWIAGQQLVVALITILEKLLSGTMFIEFCLSTKPHDVLEVIVYVQRDESFNLWKYHIWISMRGNMLSTQKVHDCCQIHVVME